MRNENFGVLIKKISTKTAKGFPGLNHFFLNYSEHK